MSETHSITELIEEVRAGESVAAHEMWDRCRRTLIREARRKLRQLPRRAVDEEDVALAAFDAFLRGVKENRFAKLENRDDLWQVLAMLTERRAIAELRRELAEKRGGGETRGESVFEQFDGEGSLRPGINEVGDPNPAMVDMFTVEVREMLEKLNDDLLRRVAIGRLEGYQNKELADRLGISPRAVDRKLNLIRHKWEGERDPLATNCPSTPRNASTGWPMSLNEREKTAKPPISPPFCRGSKSGTGPPCCVS